MTPRHYTFVTIWRLRAPLAEVWNTVLDGERWPEWWTGVEQVTTVRSGGEDHLGGVTDQVWKSALPYRLRMRIEIVAVRKLHRIEVTSEGELHGRGLMQFNAALGITELRFDWDVATTRPWMNVLAPVMRGLFGWNHAYIMKAGAVGLAKRLDATLVSVESS